jgi:hypothetical protein
MPWNSAESVCRSNDSCAQDQTLNGKGNNDGFFSIRARGDYLVEDRNIERSVQDRVGFRPALSGALRVEDWGRGPGSGFGVRGRTKLS